MDAGAVRRIAVIGAGQMGAGIAEVAARAGIEVALCDSSVERAELGRTRLLDRLERLVQKGKLTTADVTAVASAIRPLDFDQALAAAEFVVEAASENAELKLALFARADAAAPLALGLASNTSSISITRLAAATRQPTRVLGMHFMNPVPLMKLVELVRGVQTAPATLELGRSLALRLGKTVIVSQDSPGFLMNRMLLPFLNEACFALQEGVGSVEDIDQGARLGLNHPLGPLELADLIGLDTVLAIAEVLQRELGDDKYRPATSLRNLVAAGHLGKKSGRGFYTYDASGQKVGPAPSGGSE